MPCSLNVRMSGALRDWHSSERPTIIAQQEAQVAVRKCIRSGRPRVRSSGHRPRTHPVCPAPETQPVPKYDRLQQVSLDEELLLKVVMLALRLQVVHRTTPLIQQRLSYPQCDQHGDTKESLRVAVCNPLAVLTRLSEEIGERLGGQGVFEPPA